MTKSETENYTTEHWFARLRRGAAALLVFAGLAAFAYWGQRVEWDFFGSGRGAELTAQLDMVSIPGGVRFTSTAAFDQSGIGVAPATIGSITESIELPGELQFLPNSVNQVASRAKGVVWRVMKKVGDKVSAGETMVIINAPALAESKAAFQISLVQSRQAIRVLDSLRAAGSVIAQSRFQQAEADASQAHTRLQAAAKQLAALGLPINVANWVPLDDETASRRLAVLGLPEYAASAAPSEPLATGLLPVMAHQAGEVTASHAMLGEFVDETSTLFIVADSRRMALKLAASSVDVAHLAPGQRVEFRADTSRRISPGVVTTIAADADPTTRTIAVTCELANESGQLRAHGFGNGRIFIREAANSILVPIDAVHRVNDKDIVMVRDPAFLQNGPKTFIARSVTVGIRGATEAQISANLSAGEIIATRGSARLTSAIGSSKHE